MKPELVIIALLIIIAIQLVVLFFALRKCSKKHEKVRGKFAYYLDSLDRENMHLKTGKESQKSRRDYKKILS